MIQVSKLSAGKLDTCPNCQFSRIVEAHPRYLESQVEKDLELKMVFVAGPRQVGKTTVARVLPRGRQGYLNWDVAEDRKRILRREFLVSPLWIFDEIHKYRSWCNLLKGLYDAKSPPQEILVTGSARLDLYRRGGDLLQGRYYLLRLHPLSVAELSSPAPAMPSSVSGSASVRM